MRKTLLRGLATFAALVVVLGFAPVVAVLAETGPGNPRPISTPSDAGDAGENDQTGQRGQVLRQRLQEMRQRRQPAASQRLDDNRLRVCEQHKTRIESIMNRAVVRSERQLTLFDTIAKRVKNYYKEKNLKLDNYQELDGAAGEAQAKAAADLDVLKSLVLFDCQAGDPKGSVAQFKLALKTVNQDLQDYRTAIKDLIAGVKSAGGGIR